MVVSIDWNMVEEHYQKQLNNPRRLRLDPEALRWSPLVPGHNVSVQQDSDEVGCLFMAFLGVERECVSVSMCVRACTCANEAGLY